MLAPAPSEGWAGSMLVVDPSGSAMETVPVVAVAWPMFVSVAVYVIVPPEFAVAGAASTTLSTGSCSTTDAVAETGPRLSLKMSLQVKLAGRAKV